MAGVDVLATAFSGANAAFIAEMYARWVENPASVDPSFAAIFSAMDDEARAVLTDALGASWAPRAPLVAPQAPVPPALEPLVERRLAERRAPAAPPPAGDAVRAATKD